MHLDLLDAVSWALENNITHHDQVAIFGASYGGYATLWGLTATPDKLNVIPMLAGRSRCSL